MKLSILSIEETINEVCKENKICKEKLNNFLNSILNYGFGIFKEKIEKGKIYEIQIFNTNYFTILQKDSRKYLLLLNYSKFNYVFPTFSRIFFEIVDIKKFNKNQVVKFSKQDLSLIYKIDSLMNIVNKNIETKISLELNSIKLLEFLKILKQHTIPEIKYEIRRKILELDDIEILHNLKFTEESKIFEIFEKLKIKRTKINIILSLKYDIEKSRKIKIKEILANIKKNSIIKECNLNIKKFHQIFLKLIEKMKELMNNSIQIFENEVSNIEIISIPIVEIFNNRYKLLNKYEVFY